MFFMPGYWDTTTGWQDGDYHLFPESPCIDSGSPEPGVFLDIEGNVRPFGLGFDMGAYETFPNADLDNDALTNYEESVTKRAYAGTSGTYGYTDPLSWDTDFDLIDDLNDSFPLDSLEYLDSDAVETYITFDLSDQKFPDIFGDVIAWQDIRNGTFNIYAYNLSDQSLTRISPTTTGQWQPSISGDRIVWHDNRTGDLNIFIYDLTAQAVTQITSDPSDQKNAAISGDRIVWQDNRNSVLGTSWDIYMYDLAAHLETSIATGPSDQNGPAISGDRIVWYDDRTGDGNIFMYDLAAGLETQITSHPSEQWHSAISGDRIVWVDSRNSTSASADIYMYDLSAPAGSELVRITNNPANQFNPDISGDRIIWGDRRGGLRSVYMYDLSTGEETLISTAPNRFTDFHAIFGDKVVWQDQRDGNWDIYLSTGDGVGDTVDNCRWDYNPSQDDGDSDGIGDVCDNCPDDYNPGQENTVGDPGDAGDVCSDFDGDTYTDQVEIDSGSDPYEYDSTPEVCDGIDNDLDTLIDEGFDSDGDGYTTCGADGIPGNGDDDCDDGNSAINPGTDWYRDNDGDLYSDGTMIADSCADPSATPDFYYIPDDLTATSGDCNDSDPAINPGATEVCDGVDNNCVDGIDDADPNVTGQQTFYVDADSDGFGNSLITSQLCTTPPGLVSNQTDCDDSNPNIYPGAPEEIGNSIDDDCNPATSDSNGGVDYQTSDMEGTWRMSQLMAGDGVNMWYYGSGEIDNSGTIVAQYDCLDSEAGGCGGAGGTVTVSSTGSVAASGNPNFSGFLSRDKNTVIAVDTIDDPSGTQYSLLVMQRAAAGFTLSDLSGEWINFNLSAGDRPQWVGWDIGSINIDGSGTATFTLIADSMGASVDTDTLALTIDTNGVITSPGNTAFRGYMSANRDILVGTNGAEAESKSLWISLRKGSGFATDQLAGIWKVHKLKTGDEFAPYNELNDWLVADCSIDASNVLNCTAIESNGNTNIVGPFALDVDNLGVVTMSIDPSYRGQIALDANLAVSVDGIEGGGFDLAVMQRTSGPVTIDVPSYVGYVGTLVYAADLNGAPDTLTTVVTGSDINTSNGEPYDIWVTTPLSGDPWVRYYSTDASGFYEVGQWDNVGGTSVYSDPKLPILLETFIPGMEYLYEDVQTQWGNTADWSMTIEFELVSVPMGTFANCLKATTFLIEPGLANFVRTDWFANGIGKVKSVMVDESDGSTTTFELADVDSADFDNDGDGYTENDGDCDDYNEAVYPGADEVCDGVDNDCNSLTDDADPGVTGAPTWFEDLDGDGYTSDIGNQLIMCDPGPGYCLTALPGDCDDDPVTGSSINPGAEDIRGNCVDEDCDGMADEYEDPSSALPPTSEITGLNYNTSEIWGPLAVVYDYSIADTGDNGHIYQAVWDFMDDGNVSTVTYQNLELDPPSCIQDVSSTYLYVFPDPGTYKTTLTTIDNDGYASSTSVIVELTHPPADITVPIVDYDGIYNVSWSASASTGTINYVLEEATTDTTFTINHRVAYAGANTNVQIVERPFGETYFYRVKATKAGAGDSAWVEGNNGTQVINGDVDGDTYLNEIYGGTDCDDADSTINPGATELCDYIDNNCDGSPDEIFPNLGSPCWNNYGSCTSEQGIMVCAAVGSVEPVECNAPWPVPTQETCDGTDNDCDGFIDDADTDIASDDPIVTGASIYFHDGDLDGYGDASSSGLFCSAPASYVADSSDCNDLYPEVFPGNPEVCDGLDNDCDGVIDNDSGAPTNFYADSDTDGFGDPDNVVTACDAPPGYVADNTDCDDDDITSYPDGDEVCDGSDNNCDGRYDEDYPDTDGDLVADCVDPDDDGDWVDDPVDNCPLVYNLAPQGDFDTDGIGDLCDPDADGDGFEGKHYGGDDCNDRDPTVYPGDGTCEAIEEQLKPRNPPEVEDTDGDGVLDPDDNCPSVANANQENADSDSYGDACDPCPVNVENDQDGDGVCENTDNCPLDLNPGQEDLDQDTLGDACDSDVDGDGIVPPQDCNDLDAGIPTAEIPGNGVDDDCDPATPDTDFFIEATWNLGVPMDQWLPTVGEQIVLLATAYGPGGALPNPVTYTVVSQSSMPGTFNNDASGDAGVDIVADPAGGNLQLTVNDSGGSITILMEAFSDNSDYIWKEITLPVDADGNGLADHWEGQYAVALGGANDDPDNDGLTNLEEFRGVVWGQLKEYVSGTYQYQTPAFVPDMAGPAFTRTNPLRKDFFVQYYGYDAHGYPFAVGSAFKNAGIDIHALNSDLYPLEVQNDVNIDVATIGVVSDRNYSIYEDGHINKRGLRDFTFDTMGSSGLGNILEYGVGTTLYYNATQGYLLDLPYVNNNAMGGMDGMLDPPAYDWLEDINDNGILDYPTKKDYEDDHGPNVDVIDGDYVIIGQYGHHLSTFDINANGMYELPIATDPSNITVVETEPVQVYKHTTTHELGHVLGMRHNSFADCLMYHYTNNWARDHNFSELAVSEAYVHNE
jgi:beta propeller repeat protein